MRRDCCRAAARAVGVFVWLAAVALAGGQERTQAQLLQDAIQRLETRGDVRGAIPLFLEATKGPDQPAAARAWLLLGDAYEKLGSDRARAAYLRAESFKDQPAVVAEARARRQRLVGASSRRAREGMAFTRLWSSAYSLLGPPLRNGNWVPVMDWDVGELCLRDPLTDESVQVTRGRRFQTTGEFPYSAAISRDGKRIAYASQRTSADGHWQSDLRVSATGGADARTLMSRADADMFVGGWTSDGREVLVVAAADLILVRVEAASLRVLARLPDAPRSASLSPDGLFVAYDVPQDGSLARDIAVREVASGGEFTLHHRADDLYPLWTSDGRRIVFASNRTGSMGIWQVDVNAGRAVDRPHLVFSNSGLAVPMGLSASGALYLIQPTTGPGPDAGDAGMVPAVAGQPPSPGLRKVGWETWVLARAIPAGVAVRRP